MLLQLMPITRSFPSNLTVYCRLYPGQAKAWHCWHPIVRNQSPKASSLSRTLTISPALAAAACSPAAAPLHAAKCTHAHALGQPHPPLVVSHPWSRGGSGVASSPGPTQKSGKGPGVTCKDSRMCCVSSLRLE